MTTSDDDPDALLPWTSERVLAALAEPPRPVKKRLLHEPSGDVLVEALRAAETERARKILCDVLGERHEKMAVAALIEQLDADGIRSSAADALAKIGDPAAGGALAAFFERETVPGRRAMLAAALGAVGHRASAPLLIAALADESESVRGSAAWSLGHLLVKDALEPLRAAIGAETGAYPKERMSEAIDRIERLTAREG